MPLLLLKQSVHDHTGCDGNEGDISVDIVAVHGLDENMTDTWTDPVTKVLWLRDLLPKALNVARILTFGYNANATSFYGSKSADGIQQHAQTLVADLQADRSLEGCKERPIIFLCHGLGGILVKKALAYSSTRTSKYVEHLYSIFVSTYGILFFGTPHNGTETRTWISLAQCKNSLCCVPSTMDSHLLSAMEKDSETLQAITEQFSSLIKQFHIFFFWEETETQIENGKAYVVPESSAAPIIDNTERAGIGANHVQMVRFSDKTTSSYRTVVEALVRYCRHAPQTICRRWQQAEETLSRAWCNEAFELAGTAFDVHHNNRPFHYERKVSERPRNKHFYIPQVVSSIFTGRVAASQILEEALLAPENYSGGHQQRRYIIHGIGGSGKTQFCSKFAQDRRERFWGVFWIDATSTETAKQSFAKIGKLGGLEATQNAGKHWLSNAEEPWLLIINNADDPSLDLVDLFPEGDRGNILVTTRNPNFKVHATVGAMELKGMEEKDALTLLLRAADTERPWTSAVETTGNKITDTLGHLALALVQAGALILQKICDLHDYLDLYNSFRSSVGACRSSGGPRNEDQLTIYATWEHSLETLEHQKTESSLDAIQLLSIVAFFHFEHIRVDIFTRAIENRVDSLRHTRIPSALEKLCNCVIGRLQPPPIVPDFLKQGVSKRDLFRVRRALNELRSFSLISYDGKDDSFSLHPVVHSWAKDRLNSGSQAVWAQVALNVLAHSIQLPPKDVGEKHEDFRRDILVHLDLCLKARPLEILDFSSMFGGYRLPFALLFQNMWLFIFREQVTNAAKYGYVYYERGRFHEAAKIFFRVKDALVQSRGYNDNKTMMAMLALAGTFWGLGRLEEGVALQKIVVESRTKVNGSDYTDTLSAMDQLGKSYWLNGQYKEALEIQTLTVERMSAKLGPHDESTLNAMDNLGVTYGSWFRYQESKDIHQEVLRLRNSMKGPNHLDTLTTMNNVAMALHDLGDYPKSRKLMQVVYEQRGLKLGREHPWTLWALCNLAKVTSALRFLTEAEEMLTSGIAAAKRSLGDDHLGVLMGVGELARVYARQGRLNESEQLTLDLIERLEKSRGEGHPDTVYALSKLAELYQIRGNIEKAVATCRLAIDRAEMKLKMEHPMTQSLVSRLADLLNDKQDGGNSEAAEKELNHTHHGSIDASATAAAKSALPLRSSKTF